MRTFPMASPQTGNPVEDVNAALATMRPAPGRDAGLERARGMWAKQDKPAYRSLGLKPFVDRAAKLLGFGDRSLLLRTEQTWHVSQIQNSLGYLGDQSDPKAQKEIFDRVMSIRNALATALVAIDMAADEASKAFGLPMLKLAVEPQEATICHVEPALPFTVDEPAPLTVDTAPSVPQWEEETTDEPEQLRPPVDSGERGDIFGPPERRGRRSPKQADRG